MAPVIGLLCADPESRREISLLAGEAGYGTHPMASLEQALEEITQRRPDAVLLVDLKTWDGERLLREILRAVPLMPVVIAAQTRDAARAVSLMRLGAAEVVSPPWTKEGLSACLSKAIRSSGTALSLAPRARPRRIPLYFLALSAFLTLCFGILSLRHARDERQIAATRVDFKDLPYRHPSGLAWDGSYFWVSDWFSQSLYVHAPPNLNIIRVVHFTDKTPLAVLFAQGFVWRLDASGLIVRSSDDERLQALQKYNAPGTISMAYDGLYFWTLDDRGKIHKRLPDIDLTEIASYQCPDHDPVAVAYDGKTLWVLDARNREIVRLNPERPDEGLERIPLPEYSAGRYLPVGLAWDGKNFWTVGQKNPNGSGQARLFKHPGQIR
ncbi:MAG: response regulator [Elusimicrobiota bacterium]